MIYKSSYGYKHACYIEHQGIAWQSVLLVEKIRIHDLQQNTCQTYIRLYQGLITLVLIGTDCIHLIGSYVNQNTCYYCQDSYKESQTMCLFIYTNVLYFNNTYKFPFLVFEIYYILYNVTFQNKTDCHDIAEILLKVTLNIIIHVPNYQIITFTS